MTDTARWKSTVYVGGLSSGVTVQTLQEAFLPFGEIADVSLPKNENPNTAADEPHRGFAYVEFEDAEDAKEAIDNMDQAEIFGRVIKVSAAKAPKSAGQRLGGKTAVWEQVSSYSRVWGLSVKVCLGADCECRKDGLRSMLSVRRTGWRRSRLRIGPKTLCKGLRDWILPGLNRSEDVAMDLLSGQGVVTGYLSRVTWGKGVRRHPGNCIATALGRLLGNTFFESRKCMFVLHVLGKY